MGTVNHLVYLLDSVFCLTDVGLRFFPPPGTLFFAGSLGVCTYAACLPALLFESFNKLLILICLFAINWGMF